MAYPKTIPASRRNITALGDLNTSVHTTEVALTISHGCSLGGRERTKTMPFSIFYLSTAATEVAFFKTVPQPFPSGGNLVLAVSALTLDATFA